LTDINIALQDELDAIASNSFGEHYLFAINRNLFRDTDASTVFRSYYGDSLFEEDYFYIIAGTDSGLLYQYVKAHGIPKGSRYLFLETPEVFSLLENLDDGQEDIAVTAEEEWLTIAEKMGINKYTCMGRLTTLRSLGVVHGHFSPYPQFWRKIKMEFDAYLTNSRMMIQVRPFVTTQIMNLTENQIPATCLLNTFKGKTAVILAGGPSLDSLLPWVKEHRKNLLVIAVSRIGRTLQKADLHPDIFISVDPQDHNLYVSKDMLAFQEDAVLVYNYHLSPNLLASWGGAKAFIGPRYPWSTPLQPEFISPGGGATVTNSAMELAVNLGVAQIILCGADFCFNQEGYTHASGTAEKDIGPMPQLCQLQIETNSGRMADTENSYLQSSQYIDVQAKAAKEKGCRVINPSPDAMRLGNVEYIPTNEIQIEKLDQPAREIISASMPPSEQKSRITLYKEELGEVDRILDELRTIKELANKGLQYNKKVYAANKKNNVADDKNIDTKSAQKINRIEEQLNGKYKETINFLKVYDITRFTEIYRLEIGELEDNIQNNQIFFQALIDTSSELINMLRETRTRILSRLEEEKPQANVKYLIEQWRNDKQPGRALQWAQHHADAVNNLAEDVKKELDDFQNTFEESIEESGSIYLKKIKAETELDGIAARAREQFLCQDEAGLNRILVSLHKHKDQSRAVHYIALVEGYLAEITDDSEQAIKSYGSITDESAQMDALKRLFNIFTQKQDWERALETLEKLSAFSETYIPMYADLLQAIGESEAAINIYTEYLLKYPDDLKSMMKLGNLFLKSGTIDGVTWTMNYILDKDPNNHAAKKILEELNLSQSSCSSKQ
jgi:hypothetical protein